MFYDHNDLPYARKLKDERFRWLKDIGAIVLHEAQPDATGFLFSYQHGESHLVKQIGNRSGIHDRPDERQKLVNLDDVLRAILVNGIEVPTPKTWVLEIDEELPDDLEFPLFVRTRKSSWKRGGDQAKVRNRRELADESELLRRVFGWDTPIIAREWLEIAMAGQWMFGDAPQEIRTWIADGEAVAWSFHYLHAVPNPVGFPPSPEDLSQLRAMATTVAGTANEQVFKYVASRLIGKDTNLISTHIGGESWRKSANCFGKHSVQQFCGMVIFSARRGSACSLLRLCRSHCIVCRILLWALRSVVGLFVLLGGPLAQAFFGEFPR